MTSLEITRTLAARAGVPRLHQPGGPRRLVFTWQWDGGKEISRVSLELASVDAGTALSLTQDHHLSESSRDSHVEGWESCLDRLPGYLAAPRRP